MTAYERLVERHEEIAVLSSCNALSSWDQETGLPPKAVPYRAAQRAYLSERIHALKTAPEVGGWLREATKELTDSESEAAANVRWWEHSYERATKIPSDLVGELEKTGSMALKAWEEARAGCDFATFKPYLQKLIDLNCRMAELWGYEDSPYDALLEEYERGARTTTLTQLFAGLRPSLVALADEAIRRQELRPPRSLQGSYPLDKQRAFNREVCESLGFDFEAGRIDTTTHPFCSRLAPFDTRLTTRYDETLFTSSFFGVMHEAGHGLYEQGLPQDKHALPSGASVSLGIHESQSRLWENHVGRGAAFWRHWLPRAAHYFPHLAEWTPEEMTAAVNRAERSFIRVEADELTYDLHIILRFDLERRLIERRLTVDEIPETWNAACLDLLGLEVRNDAEGCLQDIHWSMGAFGYFPTYTLGNLNAAQLFQQALTDAETVRQLEDGDYSRLLSWLQKAVHEHGCRHLPDELMRRATGRPTEPAPYLDHLRSRYLG